MDNFDYIRSNYFSLKEEIAELGKVAGREVTLVAVTKSGESLASAKPRALARTAGVVGKDEL